MAKIKIARGDGYRKSELKGCTAALIYSIQVLHTNYLKFTIDKTSGF